MSHQVYDLDASVEWDGLDPTDWRDFSEDDDEDDDDEETPTPWEVLDVLGFDPDEEFKDDPTFNAFCPTGPGGGIDNSCPPSKEGRQGWPGFPAEGHVTETPEFRRWFAGSKVVDEHGAPKDTAPIRGVRDGYGGEPIVVYHGTPRGPFDEFRADKIADPDHLHFGPGFYFTEDVKAAEQFAKGGHSAAATGDNPTVMTYYLRSLNPFDADTMSIDPSKLPASERALARAALVQKTYAEEGRSEAVAKGKEFDRGEVRVRYRDLTTDRGVGGFGLDKYAVRDYLKALGHDSLTTRMHDVGRPGANRYWVIFEPTQVKSTGNRGAFDPADPNVRNVLADLAREFQ